MIVLGANGTAKRLDVFKGDDVLKMAQRAVEGYVEQVAVPGMPGLVLLVNEDGRAKKLRINALASVIAGQPIVGDAVLAVRVRDGNAEDGETWR